MEDFEKRNKLLGRQYVDLEGIRAEFLKYAPAYAQKEAAEALQKLIELQGQGLIGNGIYYIVLVDLVGSTKYSAEYGNEKLANRIRWFVKFGFESIVVSKLRNTAIFLKEIGDAILYVFHHFPDILKWRNELQGFLNLIGNNEPPYILRTCIHIGEVALDGVNPISLAVSQTFKMEKSVNANDIVLTEPAYHVAWPTIARAYHGFSNYGSVTLDGYKDPLRLYRLDIHDKDDLERILVENTGNSY